MNQGTRRQRAAQAAHQSAKSVRKVGKRAFAKIETAFEQNLKHCQSLQREVTTLEQIVKDRKIISIQKDGSTVEQNLSAVQVIGYRKRLNEAKLELKYAAKKLDMQSKRYAKASKINSKAAREKVKKFNSDTKLARTAAKKHDDILKAVNAQVSPLRKRNGEEYQNLRNLALTDGRAFNTNLYRLMRRALRDGEIIKMMAASPMVRSKVFREIRQSFGWQPKNDR